MRDWAVIPVPVALASCERKICRTFEEGLTALRDEGPWDLLYLDHDLGNQDKIEKTGYSILCWLEEFPEWLPKAIVLVTSNPVGRKKMSVLIDRLYNRA